jgi:hypothetical protein
MENKSSPELTMGLQAQYLTSDPGYMGCKNAGCGKRDASGSCQARTCAATLTFHVVNFRTDVEFVLFSGGFRTPCLLKRSGALRFANPAKPLYGHLSSTDSKATSVRTTSLGVVSPFHLAFSFYKFTTWVFLSVSDEAYVGERRWEAAAGAVRRGQVCCFSSCHVHAEGHVQ